MIALFVQIFLFSDYSNVYHVSKLSLYLLKFVFTVFFYLCMYNIMCVFVCIYLMVYFYFSSLFFLTAHLCILGRYNLYVCCAQLMY